MLTAVVISAATKLSASPFASASELEVISNLSTKVASPCARVWAEWAGVRAAAVSDSARTSTRIFAYKAPKGRLAS